MITLGLSRIDFARLAEPKVAFRQLDFQALGPVPFAESVLMMRMFLTLDIPSNVRVAARIDPATMRRLRRAIEGVLQAEVLPVDRSVFVEDGRRLQG